jgi:hypothetical protein
MDGGNAWQASIDITPKAGEMKSEIKKKKKKTSINEIKPREHQAKQHPRSIAVPLLQSQV